jgi:sugar lactone lactonase YvrE
MAQTPASPPPAQGPAAGVAPGVTLEPPRDHVADLIPGVVAARERVELLSADIQGGDGVMALPDGSAAFLELRAGRIVRIEPDKQFSTLAMAPGVKAMGADGDGNVIALMKDSFEIVYPVANARILVSGADGLSLKTCNDFVVSRAGHIYATDVGQYNQPKYNQPTGVIYIPKGGKAQWVANTRETMALPNGIVLSPDEKQLYVVDSRNNSGMVWDVRPDGLLANPRAFAKYRITEALDRDFTLQANGAAIDANGRLYVAMPLGVQVFSSEGTYLGHIPTTLKIQSVSFAGPEKDYLYMLAQRAVWRVRMTARGFRPRAK